MPKITKELLESKEDKVPIYKGCNNKECYCNGSCKEIVGWKEKDKKIFGESNKK